jgi:hypothetical protein
VRRTHPHQSTFILQSQPLGDVDCVEVAVPDEDALLAQPGCNLLRGAACQGKRSGRHSPGETGRVGDPVDAQAGDRLQAGDQPADQATFVGLDGGQASLELETPAGEARKSFDEFLAEVLPDRRPAIPS